MAHWVVLPISIAFAALYGYLRFVAARTRERAGLPPRPRVKVPLYIWALLFLLIFRYTGFLLLDSHGEWRSWPIASLPGI